jgi:AraC-like DNA-binding protein
MLYVLPAQGREDVSITHHEPPHTSAALLPYVEATVTTGSFGKLTVQEDSGYDCYFSLNTFEIREPTAISVLNQEAVAMLTYMLKGQSSFSIDGEHDVSISEGYYYLLYVPEGLHPIQLEPGNYTFVHIKLMPPLLEKLCFKHYALYNVWASAEERLPVGVLQACSPINGRVRDTLNRLLYCPLEEEERALFQEARVMDLLLLYVEDLSARTRDVPGRFNFTAADIQAIKEAGELKIERAGDPLLLKDIAKKTNLHPRKLQEGIKLVYGKGARALTIESRMEKAKALLLQGDMPIADIAYEVGYSNDSAFIRAFKRHVGVTPASYRK